MLLGDGIGDRKTAYENERIRGDYKTRGLIQLRAM